MLSNIFANVDWLVVVSSVLGLISVVAGTFLAKTKGKLGQVVVTAKEFVDVAEAFEEALKDNNITEEEITVIKTQFLEAKAALKTLLNKE